MHSARYGSGVRIATWNVNSLKARLERVLRWIAMFDPDVVCLQETKLADAAFPAVAFGELGYDCLHHGQGRWNGVAILSRVGIEDPVWGFGDGAEPDRDARIVWATCDGVRVASCYVPNGRSLEHEQYQYKLAWLDRLAEDIRGQVRPDDELVVSGDFNIAPEDRDVWSPAMYEGGTHVSQAERDRLATLTRWGLFDVFREQYNEGGLYTWWDYRAGAFHKRQGMRIDLVLATRSVADKVSLVIIDRNERKGPKTDPPSDHAPVLMELQRRSTSRHRIGFNRSMP